MDAGDSGVVSMAVGDRFLRLMRVGELWSSKLWSCVCCSAALWSKFWWTSDVWS